MPFEISLILWLLILLIPLTAQINVKLTFSKYKKVMSKSGLTADKAAKQILDGAGLGLVKVKQIGGKLTDRYEPDNDTIKLSESVYGDPSVASIGVAAHECGHAIQYAENYAPIIVRSKLVPVTSFCSKSWYYVVLVGAMMSRYQVGTHIMTVGVLLFTVLVLFQMATLPVEIDASKRALKVIESRGILDDEELRAAKKVLTAAALTYVASLLSGILQLIRLILMSQNRRRR